MKENTLYLECYSGISGDMTVAALLDLGADQQLLLEGLASLNVEGYQIEIGRRTKNSIDACDFNVILEHDEEHSHEDSPSHTHLHPHDNLHPHLHSHPHEEDSSHEHKHKLIQEPSQEHSDNHSHQEVNVHKHSYESRILQPQLVLGHHEHRNLEEIYTIINQSKITENAKALSRKIFHIIAIAEAKAHAKPVEEVHFHEVGAIDSIVDIVAAAICYDNLNINKVIVSELYEGTGQIRCQHGLIPVPVPAVVNISSAHELTLHITNVIGELVTPTGAAIVAAIKTSSVLPTQMRIQRIGLGAGKRNYPNSSGILRAMLIEDSSITSSALPQMDQVWVMEANIDDCSGEALALTMELLFEAGAKDVYYTPIFMKKNRPAYLLGVICTSDFVEKLEGIIFMNTTTIGIRKHQAERTILPREIKTITTPFGEAQVKICSYLDQHFIYPEFESVKALCQKTGQDYMTMYQYVKQIAQADED